MGESSEIECLSKLLCLLDETTKQGPEMSCYYLGKAARNIQLILLSSRKCKCPKCTEKIKSCLCEPFEMPECKILEGNCNTDDYEEIMQSINNAAQNNVIIAQNISTAILASYTALISKLLEEKVCPDK